MSLLSCLTRRAAGSSTWGTLRRQSCKHVLNNSLECLSWELTARRTVTAENSLPIPKSNCRGTEQSLQTIHLEGLALSWINSVELLCWHIRTKEAICWRILHVEGRMVNRFHFCAQLQDVCLTRVCLFWWQCFKPHDNCNLICFGLAFIFLPLSLGWDSRYLYWWSGCSQQSPERWHRGSETASQGAMEGQFSMFFCDLTERAFYCFLH